MISRRLALALFAVSVSPLAALAAPFDEAAFTAAQSGGKSILVEVTAPWCPTCKAQAPILSGLRQKPEFRNYAVFTIDFDSQKDLLRRFGVTRQSTLIVFRGKTEAGRSVGDTNAASIEQLLKKAG